MAKDLDSSPIEPNKEEGGFEVSECFYKVLWLGSAAIGYNSGPVNRLFLELTRNKTWSALNPY